MANGIDRTSDGDGPLRPFRPRLSRARGEHPQSFIGRINKAVAKARAASGRTRHAKPSGRFNARGRGAKVAPLLKGHGGWETESGMRFRSRRVVVKARVVKFAGGGSKAAQAHLRYLMREGAGLDRSAEDIAAERARPDEFDLQSGLAARLDGDCQRAMPNYRRLFIPGGTFFFTANLLDRRTRLLTENIDALRAAYGAVARRHAFETVAICILPEHLHCIWRFPPGDHDYPLRWRLIKSLFSKALPCTADARGGRRKGERGVWQRRFWEHAIRDAKDLDRHVDYIHWNPVKHRLVRTPDDWPYSTYHEWKKEYGRPINIPPEDCKPVHLGER